MLDLFLKHRDVILAETPGVLCLFRNGDYYEAFEDDARKICRVIGLTLTTKDNAAGDAIAMCGFPYHALDGYLNKLISDGHRVAICEQVKDAQAAKAFPAREVTKTIR